MNRPKTRFLADCQIFGQMVGEPFTSGDPTHRKPGQPYWLQATRMTPLPGVLGVLGALAAFALLLAFCNVVSDSVQRGAQHRGALAAQAAPSWRCDTAEQQQLLRCVSGADKRTDSPAPPRQRASADPRTGLTLTSH